MQCLSAGLPLECDAYHNPVSPKDRAPFATREHAKQNGVNLEQFTPPDNLRVKG
jgi:hypothetical protein